MNEKINKLLDELESASEHMATTYNCVDFEYNRECGRNLGRARAAVIAEFEALETQVQHPCIWKHESYKDEYDYWFTECGHQHIFNSGTAEENEFKFCPYCGKPIQGNDYERS